MIVIVTATVLLVFFSLYFRPHAHITRSIQEQTGKGILEKKENPNNSSSMFKVEGLPQQDHF
jgi:hypothetical protein